MTGPILTEPLWRSWFSGIYGKRQHDVALRFPGGTLKDGAAGIEWRELNPTGPPR